MRAPGLALAFLVILLVAVPPASAQDFWEVGKVNRLISVFETPQLAPGETGTFRGEFNSTYAEAIANVSVTVDIYRYATIEDSVPVDASWPYAFPRIRESGGRSLTWPWSSVASGTAIPINFTVETAADSRDMPHGSVFSQATYFLRFRVEFDGDVGGNPEHFVMASRGYFSDDVWRQATDPANTEPCNPPSCRGYVNLTILDADVPGVDGIVADSSFGVKEPIPQWPFYLLVAGAVGFLVLAFLFWVEENPSTYPRIAAWWAKTRGRIVRARRTVLRPRSPPP